MKSYTKILSKKILISIAAFSAIGVFAAINAGVSSAAVAGLPCLDLTPKANKTKCESAVTACSVIVGVDKTTPAYKECVKRAVQDNSSNPVDNSTSASPVSAAERCKLKAREADCITTLKACKNAACITNKLKTFTNVSRDCQEVTNPQDCNAKLSALVEQCQTKKASSPSEILVCRNAAVDSAKKAGDPGSKSASSASSGAGPEHLLDGRGAIKDTCGEGKNAVETQFNFGCTGKGTPIEDFIYAIIKFLSYGVGLVMMASIIYAGLQYTSSEGNAEATQAAKTRIKNALIGLVFYIGIWAIVQYLVPGGLFN